MIANCLIIVDSTRIFNYNTHFSVSNCSTVNARGQSEIVDLAIFYDVK